MRTRSAERKQFLYGIFTTALEGGIGYWSGCSAYHRLNEDDTDDLDGFYADVIEYDDDDGDGTPHRIDADTIAHGVSVIAKAKVFYVANAPKEERHSDDADVKYLDGTTARIVKFASRVNDVVPDEENAPGGIDADVADNVVQVGLFGEVRYA